MAIEYRWADGQYDRLPALAADLVRRRVAVIAATGGTPAALAAKAATATIPIVFAIGTDPVQLGLVASLNRPGGNLTGVNTLTRRTGGEAAGAAARAGPHGDRHCRARQSRQSRLPRPVSRDLQAAARTLGLQLHVLHASTERDIDAVFATLAQLRAGGLVIGSDRILHQPERTARRTGGSPRGACDLPNRASSPQPAA